MATIKVSNQTQLLSALKTATGGDTILLADGNYGDITLKSKFASTVTIQAVNPQGASFSSITLNGVSNMSFDGLKLENGFTATLGSSHISLTNSVSDDQLYFRNVNGLVVDKVTATGGQYGIVLNTVQNFTVTNSTFGKVTEDIMRITGDSYNGLVENNVLADTIAQKPTHPDIIQFFAANGAAPHDITIRGNLLYDDPSTGSVSAQGIFVSDPGTGDANKGYTNITIEDNLIRTNSTNTIFINSGHSTVKVLNNTLIGSESGDGGNIRLVGKTFSDGGPVIDGNVFKALINETGSVSLGDNYIYTKYSNLSSLFHDPAGSSWESFVPVSGSAIDFGTGFGAQERLSELLLKYYNQTSPVVETRDSSTAESSSTSGYHLDKVYEMSGVKKDIAVLDHDKDLAIDTGSIQLTFNADTVSGNRGLISKGGEGYDDDFSAWIQNGKLVLAFENPDGQKVTITKAGIKANTDYDLLITFDEKNVTVWLDNTKVGQATFDLDLSGNSEYLVLGGVNGQSARGTVNKVGSFFDGTISNLSVYDTVLTPSEFAALEVIRHSHDVATTGNHVITY